jgi:hypothetical protein
MKRSMILLAAVFAMASTSLLAQNSAADKADAATSKSVVLSDAELDNITAGSASVVMAVFNSGNADVSRLDDITNAHCVNCASNPFGGNAKVMLIQNPGHTVFKCMGAAVGFPGLGC